MEAIGRLSGAIAHDFNNLLTAINGYSQLMAQIMPEDAPQRQYVDEVLKAGQRGVDMTNELMRLSRRQPIQRQVIDPRSLLKDLANRLRPQIGEGITLEVHYDQGLGGIAVDPAQIDQALVTLAINANNAMPEGGQLRIEARNVVLTNSERGISVNPGQYVRFEVSDTGSGIDPVRLEHIFEPLFKIDKHTKSSGFGLAQAYMTVTRSGGHIDVESTLGKGTTFRILLPRAG